MKNTTPSDANTEINLTTFLDSKFTFGEYLRTLRNARKTSIRELAKQVKKTPTYISDIEKGNNRPPDENLLNNIIVALNLGDGASIIKNKLFDLAAKERGVVSADIADFIMQDDDVRNVIRLAKTNEQMRNQILNIVK
ncbi:helix-turn-helix domain-containing protein [Paenibacillus sp. MZ04-78.2]|uniref:helix-turn-helix domain-containing protein n=1 Tax=Paenibacillus sp. MZ04-78.2 TaxID=2962034 RepID=UPI0020B7D5C2|nr:helix-turn-helix transcriptional regulator [Paenibacillus sp. MZ04-78.2]MCP3775496.1 helix-turn-helix domain-containing protein [Paenibacillus sp. MZ04-78.2]